MKTSFNDKYIVVLKQDPTIKGLDVPGKKHEINLKAKGLLKKYGINGEVEEIYETALHGFCVKTPPGQIDKLEKDDNVDYIEPDQPVTMYGKKPKPTTTRTTTKSTTTVPPSTQTIPWGVTRVGGPVTYTGSSVAWVIDSGIDLTHPDLNVDRARGISYVSGIVSPNDDNGHGTHVAGIIAAKNNTTGVVGVAAGAAVVPVKVLDSTGSGTFSGVLAGVNYVAANGIAGDVANMSLGGGISPTLDAAVVSASATVKFIVAAGNETDDAINHSPARASLGQENIYAISAMASGDSWASFSNYGTPVDYCAPGVSIYSTYKGGGYASLSGTSMAAPHVAGILLIGPAQISGYVKNDPDGVPDPIAHV